MIQIDNVGQIIADFFKNFDFGALFSDVKTIFIILSWVLGALFVVILIKLWRSLKPGIIKDIENIVSELNPPAPAVAAYDNRWEEIKSHVVSFNEAEWKLAVIEADKFVDDALKKGGFPGETMGERLMLMKPDQLLTLQGLWDAHKLRNLLVHDANYQINHRQAVVAVEFFESVLQELGALS